MKRVNFYYSTKLTFDDYVHGHSFALRVIPPETETQHILSCSLNISPYVSTTAAQAFALKKGVCQDFSHILISLLRMDGIAARYIAGLAFCDGETHSWVEYWTGDHWEGIDPANNCPVSDDYIVISQGRDFRDCAIDRGVMFGQYTKQLQLVRSVLT